MLLAVVAVVVKLCELREHCCIVEVYAAYFYVVWRMVQTDNTKSVILI